MPTAPDTVTAAIEVLRGEGFADDVELIDGHLCWAGDTWRCAVDEATIERTFRFEGDSDPGDEMIVLGVTAGTHRGVLVSAFGLDADPALPDLLRRRTD